MTSQYLSPTQVETIYPNLTAARLARWRWAKTGPAFVKLGRVVIYRREDIEAYVAANLVKRECA